MSDMSTSPDPSPVNDERHDRVESGIHSMSSRDTNTVTPLSFEDWAAMERARLTNWNRLSPLQRMEHYRTYPGSLPADEALQALVDQDDYDVDVVDDTILPTDRNDDPMIEVPPFRPLV
jgi:hypothetical protein